MGLLKDWFRYTLGNFDMYFIALFWGIIWSFINPDPSHPEIIFKVVSIIAGFFGALFYIFPSMTLTFIVKKIIKK